MRTERLRYPGALAALFVLALIVFGGTVYAAGGGSGTTTTICQPSPTPFSVTGVVWGTPGDEVGAGPGELDVPLTVSLLYAGPCASTAASFTLGLSGQFSGTNGEANQTDYQVNLAADTAFSETYYVNIGSDAALGVYTFPLTIGYNTSTYLGLFYQTLDATVALKGTSALDFSVASHELLGGQVNDVGVTVLNSGTGNASAIEPSVSAPAEVAVLNSLSDVQSLAPGTNETQTLDLFVPASLAGSSVSLSFAADYFDAYSVSRSSSETLGFFVTSPVPSTPYQFLGASWGSADPFPSSGDQNVPLDLSFEYVGTGQVTDLEATLLLPQGLSGQVGGRYASAYLASASPDQVMSFVFYIDIAPNATLGTTAATVSVTALSAGGSSLAQSAALTLPSVGARTSPFVLETAEWGTANSSPLPGENGVELQVSLEYAGSATSNDIAAVVDLPSGFTAQGGGASAVALSQGASPYGSVQLTFYLDLASNLALGTYSFPLTIYWSTAFASGLNESLTATPPTLGQSSSAVSDLLSVSEGNGTLVAGIASTVSFSVRNVGSGTVYTPEVSLDLPSPLVVLGASTGGTSSLAPGQSATFTATVSATPSSTPGVYGGTLTVTYADQSGTQHAQTVPVGFTLTGQVAFVLQDVDVVQSSTSLTVSGSVLDEGSASAYYAQVTGSVKGSSGSAPAYYLGEVDPNTPTPFTITVPYTAGARGGNAVILVSVDYKDSFGNNKTSTISYPQAIESSSQLNTETSTAVSSSGPGGLVTEAVLFLVVGAFVVIAVVGTVMVRRRRAAMNPEKEKNVI